MSSLELVKKLVAHGANVNARMTRKVNLNNTRANEIGATPFFLAALTADAELMKALVGARRRPALTERREQHAADGRRRASPRARRARTPAPRAKCSRRCRSRSTSAPTSNAVDNNGETAMHGAAYKNLPKVVKFLAAKGAKIDVWNRENKFGWTPLAIAVGYRFGNFKPSPDTEAAIREVMIAAGVTPPKTIVAKTQQIY